MMTKIPPVGALLEWRSGNPDGYHLTYLVIGEPIYVPRPNAYDVHYVLLPLYNFQRNDKVKYQFPYADGAIKGNRFFVVSEL